MVKERIFEFLESQGLTRREFLEKTGIKRGFLDGDKIKGGVSEKDFAKILATFPNINLKWLISGEGPMIETAAIDAVDPGDKTLEYKPMIPTKLYKQLDTDVCEYISNNHREIHLSPTIMQFSDFNLFYEVVGESMSPEFRPSDMLALQIISRPFRIFNGEVYAIDTSRGVVVRMLYEDGENFIAKAFNPRYSDTKIMFDEIYTIFRVVGLVRKNI